MTRTTTVQKNKGKRASPPSNESTRKLKVDTMTTAGPDYTYHDELGPIVKVPVNLCIPKNLYDIWNEIATRHPGWAPDGKNNRGFEYEVNWEILRLYMGYLSSNEIVLYETMAQWSHRIS